MDLLLQELLADDPNTGLALLQDSGIYQLLVDVPSSQRLDIGRLGTVQVPQGLLLYTGSAKRGLHARLARHVRKQKALRWHIDYLLSIAEILEIRSMPWKEGGECEVNQRWRTRHRVTVPIPGFGSSDCRCPAHLLHIGFVENIGQLGGAFFVALERSIDVQNHDIA